MAKMEIDEREYGGLVAQADIICNLQQEVDRLTDIIHHLIGDRNNEERDK